jgi:hypothetical protein
VAAIQHSIDVSVPITRLYIQLTQFEDYPRFLENVENVQQISKTRLHWTTRTSGRLLEWDAEVTEQEENSHIVWHNANDGNDACSINIEELGPNLSRVSFTLKMKPGQISGITGGRLEEEITQQLNKDLANLKEFLETPIAHMQAQADPVADLDVNDLDAQTQADLMNQVRTESQRRTPASVSGSPTEVLEDEPNEFRAGIPGEAQLHNESRPANRNSGKTAQ